MNLINQTDGPIWSEIEADFTYAAANLPSSRGGNYSEPGRPIKSTANAFLGKALLYQSKWAAASTALESVINSGDYALAEDYFSNFRSDGENGPEMVFSIQFAADGGQSKQGNRGGTLNFAVGPMTGGTLLWFLSTITKFSKCFPN